MSTGAFKTLQDTGKLFGTGAIGVVDLDPATRRGKYSDIVECVLGISLGNLPPDVRVVRACARACFVEEEGLYFQRVLSSSARVDSGPEYALYPHLVGDCGHGCN